MARIRAVLFDIDGTLLDSNDAHAHAWLDALRGQGKSVPFELVRSRIGAGGANLLRELAGIEIDSPAGRAIDEMRLAIFKAHYLADLGPLPGARVLVDRVRSRGLLCAAVSAASPVEVADLLREAAVADLMEVVVTGEDLDRDVPEHGLIEIALDRLGVTAREAVLVGDTPYDIEAADRVGAATVAFRTGGFRDADLAGAVAIYDGPADLASHLDDSVLAQGTDDGVVSSVVARRMRRPAMRG